LSPALCLPDPGADAGRALALPRAASGCSEEAALAGGLSGSRGDADLDAPIRRNAPLQADGFAALIHDVSVADLHAITVGGVAAARLREDQHAPAAIKRSAGRCCAVGARRQ